MIKMAQKSETVKFKNYTRKTKFLVYDHMSILIPYNNGKENPDQSYSHKLCALYYI